MLVYQRVTLVGSRLINVGHQWPLPFASGEWSCHGQTSMHVLKWHSGQIGFQIEFGTPWKLRVKSTWTSDWLRQEFLQVSFEGKQCKGWMHLSDLNASSLISFGGYLDTLKCVSLEQVTSNSFDWWSNCVTWHIWYFQYCSGGRTLKTTTT